MSVFIKYKFPIGDWTSDFPEVSSTIEDWTSGSPEM